MQAGDWQEGLQALFPAGTVLLPGQLSDAEWLAFGSDRAQQFGGRPAAVCRPRSTEDVARIVGFARQEGLKLVPSGGRTGLCGGAAVEGDEVVVAFDRMRRVLRFDPFLPALTVEAGLVTAELQKEARDRELYFPIDFAAAGSATVGGNIATNAGGIHVIRYGMMRDWVLGLTVVTGSGEVLRLGGPLLKDNTGPPLFPLFIGSEGIFGFVTEATIRLTRAPADTQLLLLALPSVGAALEALRTLRTRVGNLHAFELLDSLSLRAVREHLDLPAPFSEPSEYLGLAEFEGDTDAALAGAEALLEADIISNANVAESSAARSRFWNYREGISESLSMQYSVHKNDVALPPDRLAEFTESTRDLLRARGRGIRAAVFGHVGDGNLHINLLRPPDLAETEFRQLCGQLDEELYARIQAAGGSLSAEHGIGRLKRRHLHLARSPAEIELLRALKQLFDPLGIINPGRVLPEPADPADLRGDGSISS